MCSEMYMLFIETCKITRHCGSCEKVNQHVVLGEKENIFHEN